MPQITIIVVGSGGKVSSPSGQVRVIQSATALDVQDTSTKTDKAAVRLTPGYRPVIPPGQEKKIFLEEKDKGQGSKKVK